MLRANRTSSVWLLALSWPGVALPQNPPMPASAASEAHPCFAARPRPHCSSFWLTEFEAGLRAAASRNLRGSEFFAWEVGGMRNVSDRIGIGLTGFWTISDEGGSAGLHPRLRIWLAGDRSIDLGPGVTLSGHDLRTFRFNGLAAINVTQWAALTVRAQSITEGEHTSERGEPAFEWLVGVRLGALPGLVVGLGLPVVLVGIAALTCGWCN